MVILLLKVVCPANFLKNDLTRQDVSTLVTQTLTQPTDNDQIRFQVGFKG
jgi:hypothetical protein